MDGGRHSTLVRSDGSGVLRLGHLIQVAGVDPEQVLSQIPRATYSTDDTRGDRSEITSASGAAAR